MRGKYFLLSFLVPLIVRAIPEIVSYPWPIGFDTVNAYAPFIYNCQVYGFFTVLFNYGLFSNLVSFLFFILTGGLGALVRSDPFLILKVVAPVLSGFLGLSIFYFLTEYLGWSYKRGLICAVFCMSYFVVLRITWELLRNVLGLVFFFLAISQTKNLGERRKGFLFIFFSILCLFSHEMMAILLFVVVVYFLLLELFSSRASDLYNIFKYYLSSKITFLGRSNEATGSKLPDAEREKQEKLKKLNSHTGDEEYRWYRRLFRNDLRPQVLAIYIFIVISTLIILLYSRGNRQVTFGTNPYTFYGTGILYDYIYWGFGLQKYPSMEFLMSDVFSLFFICFAPILPFVILGYFRNHSLDVITLFLLVGSFMPVVFPHSALPLWNRWMLILAFPFIIYASNFLLPDKQDYGLIKRLKISKKTRRVTFVVMVPIIVLLSATYMVLPYDYTFPYFSIFNTAGYLSTTMQHNSIPLSQCPYATLAGEWLKWNMPPESCLIAAPGLYGWAKLSLPFRHFIIKMDSIFLYNFYNNTFIDLGLLGALFWTTGFNYTYVLTFPPYNQFLSDDFELVFHLGYIEIYRSVN